MDIDKLKRMRNRKTGSETKRNEKKFEGKRSKISSFIFSLHTEVKSLKQKHAKT
jgi:hypothetical protein